MNISKIISAIESILFAYGEPVQISRIVEALGIPEEMVLQGLERLMQKYSDNESGLTLVRKDDMVQLATKGDNATFIDSFVKNAVQESLSKAALEVLSVIAYRGPVSRLEIESIRGVNCSVTLRNLLLRGLIDRKENENDAREYLYSISFQFLRELGIESILDLPDYESLSQDMRLQQLHENKSQKNTQLEK